MRDPYEVLGASRQDSLEAITKKYRQLAKQYHPDLNPHDPTAQKRMAEINAAYDAIKSGQADQPTMNGAPQGWGASGNPFEDIFGGRYAGSSQGDPLAAARRMVMTGQYAQALFILQTVRSRNAEWYFLSAMAYAHMGQSASAWQAIRQARALDPNNQEYATAERDMQDMMQSYQSRRNPIPMPRMSLSTMLCGCFLARFFCCRC